MKIGPSFYFLVFLFLCSCSAAWSEEKKNSKNANIEHENEVIIPEVPDKMLFCGQDVKFDNFDKKERLDKELIVNVHYHSSTVQALKRSARHFPLIERILKEEGLPSDFKYLCLIESNLLQATSPSGAKGFWQFMPQTAAEYGLNVNDNFDERMHIEKSTYAACQYLKKANLIFNDWIITAAAYNKGAGGIKRDLEDQQVDDYFDLHLNQETSRYVFRILAMKLIFENPAKYGFQLKKEDYYAPFKTRTVLVSNTVENLSQWSIDNGTTLRMVKLLNPWILNSKIPIRGDTLKILLPINE